MDLRTRYTALITLITQYVKFASETLKRAEDEEVRVGRMSTLPGADPAQLTLLSLRCCERCVCFI